MKNNTFFCGNLLSAPPLLAYGPDNVVLKENKKCLVLLKQCMKYIQSHVGNLKMPLNDVNSEWETDCCTCWNLQLVKWCFGQNNYPPFPQIYTS
jgi:hypothetical protein